MARGRLLMLAAGRKMGQQQAHSSTWRQAEALKQQGAQEAMAQQQTAQAAAPARWPESPVLPECFGVRVPQPPGRPGPSTDDLPVIVE